MGADRGVRIEGEGTDPFSVAYALSEVVARENPDLVFCGVQSSDNAYSATGSALSALLELPCVAVVTRVASGNGLTVLVDRELPGGLIDRVEVDIPAVLTIQTGINEPRYANLRAIKQAETVEIAVHGAAAEYLPAYRVRRMYVPEGRAGAEVIDGTASQIAATIATLVKDRLQ
jgi:electron transfer flavoprotein beta subunit